jgi:phosphoenolpyruvate synthase/pyruvate phosphate dikinase
VALSAEGCLKVRPTRGVQDRLLPAARERDGEEEEEEEEWALVEEPEDPVAEIFRARRENRVMNRAIDELDDVFSPSASARKTA